MRFWLTLLIILASLAWLVDTIARDSGYVLIVYRQIQVESGLWFLGIIFILWTLLFSAITYGITRLIHRKKLPRTAKKTVDKSARQLEKIKQQIEQGNYHLLERQVYKTMQHQVEPILLEWYGLAQKDHPKKHLAKAEKWLEKYPEDPHVLLCLGRLCLQNHLWGKARDYLQSSLSFHPIVTVYAELAQLLQYMGEEKASQEMYQKGLREKVGSLAKLPSSPSTTMTSL